VGQVVGALPPAVKNIAIGVAPLMVYRSDEPLARLDWADATQE
jgi:hypothetical protein